MGKDNAASRDRVEWLKCSRSPAYFLHNYVLIENANDRAWVRFHLWPAQHDVLQRLMTERQFIALKARQLGITWLTIGYALWLMIFRPSATILLFSLRDTEAKELLRRVRGMYERLPGWCKCRSVNVNSSHEWALSNGSRAMAFPTTGGRSYTGSLAVIDESDLLPNLADFLNAVKPTIDAGGQMVLISTVDKKRPLSAFKEIFRAAEKGENAYSPIFLPWSARPDRDQAWYDRIAADMRSMGNGDDDLFQEYPATVEQALAPLQKDKRFPFAWLEAVSTDIQPIGGTGPALPGLLVFHRPVGGRHYCIGADSAEGNPNSDDSVATVVDAQTWGLVAILVGKVEPSVFAGYIDQLGTYYNSAPCMPERNNHGHATIQKLRDNGQTAILLGYDDKPGWASNVKGKKLLYDLAAEVIQQKATSIPDQETRLQLASIEASTLRAPTGLHDDYADAFCLALAGLKWNYVAGEQSTEVAAPDPLEEYDRGTF